MRIASFEKLLQHRRPGFSCYAGGDRSKTESLIAPVEFLLNPPADPKLLKRIPAAPGYKSAVDFYKRCNGALLYSAVNHGDDMQGIEIFPIDEWADRTEQTVDSWEESGYDDDAMPYGRKDFISFAHIRGAANYIHWVKRGRSAGNIFWWAWTDPPEIDRAPTAENFAGFIDLICNRPVYFLNEISYCYTRYSDGTTGKDWIPKRYLADCEVIDNG